MSKAETFCLVVAVIFLNAVGNLSLAWGMRHISEEVGLNPMSYVRAMINPYVACGIVLLILWLLTRMTLLSWADLSFVLPLTSLGYILAAVFGKLFLNETINRTHWAGTLLIFLGTAMIGATDLKTVEPSESS